MMNARRLVRPLALIAVLAGLSSIDAAAAVPPAPVSVRLTYAVRVHGLRVMTLTADLAFDGDRYAVSTATAPAGLFGSLLSSHVKSEATGTFDGNSVRPSDYRSAGFSRGANRSTVIAEASGHPVVKTLTPVEERRDPIPASETTDAIDPLSAVALLLHRTWQSGRCDGSALAFDGARLTRLGASTGGTVEIPASDDSPYSGAALECELHSQLLAGFLHDEHFEKSHTRQDGDAVLAPVLPGVGPVPIRMKFQTVDHGEVHLMLIRAQTVPS